MLVGKIQKEQDWYSAPVVCTLMSVPLVKLTRRSCWLMVYMLRGQLRCRNTLLYRVCLSSPATQPTTHAPAYSIGTCHLLALKTARSASTATTRCPRGGSTSSILPSAAPTAAMEMVRHRRWSKLLPPLPPAHLAESATTAHTPQHACTYRPARGSAAAHSTL